MTVNKNSLGSDQNAALHHWLSKTSAGFGDLKYTYISSADLDPTLTEITQDLYQSKGSEVNTVQALRELADKFRTLFNKYTINSIDLISN